MASAAERLREQLKAAAEGVEAWNAWREDHPEIKPDLQKVELVGGPAPSSRSSSSSLDGASLHDVSLAVPAAAPQVAGGVGGGPGDHRVPAVAAERPAQGLGISLVIFALQALLSVAWLRRFRFGPVEWLWRTATSGVSS